MELPAPKLSECTAAWESLYERQGERDYAPQLVRWHAGEIYYHHGFEEELGEVKPPGFVAMSDEGGPLRRVVEDAGLELWLEDGQLLYAKADRLYAAPIEGGEGELVSDGGMFGAEQLAERNVSFHAYGLDETHLYWTTLEFDDAGPIANVWRAARSGGSTELLATLPKAVRVIETLVVLQDTLLAVSSNGDAYVIPKSGGDVDALPEVEGGYLVGAADSGILWSLLQLRGGRASRDLWLSKPTGAEPKPFWANKRSTIEPARAWSDGGEWVLYAVEPFADGQKHLSVWSVEPDGAASRLGCDPAPYTSGVFAMAGALSPDAALLAVQRRTGWELVKIPR